MPGDYTPLAGESLLAYLVRTRSNYTWQDDNGVSEPYAIVEVLGDWAVGGTVRPRVSRAEWDRLVSAAYPDPPVPTATPPFWPGSAGVTLGDAVALVDQGVVEGPLDGVLVNVTTAPRGLGHYNIGGAVLDYGVGRITFETDGGELEVWQYLGFRSAVFVPHTMARAARARLQVLGGAGGTVTPWLRS